MKHEAQQMNQGAPIKRFYKEATVAEQAGAFMLLLDWRAAKTRGGAPLAAPTRLLAEAIAEEWNAQGEIIARTHMPLTAMLTIVIDQGETEATNWRDDIIAYLGADLVCYRAETPRALVERQADVWDPYVDFMRAEFGAPLVTTVGVSAVAQADAGIAAVRRAIAEEPPEVVFAVRLAATMTGSAVLALALFKGAFASEEIFEASRLDERFQEERWGVDEEAKAREANIRAEFNHAARFLSLL